MFKRMAKKYDTRENKCHLSIQKIEKGNRNKAHAYLHVRLRCCHFRPSCITYRLNLSRRFRA